jgi:hypothetical protein
MEFDLSELAIHCIGPLEPAFLLSLAVALIGAIVLVRPLGRVTLAMQRHRRHQVYTGLVWASCGIALLVGAVALTDALYSLGHSGHVCTAFVWPAYLIPPVVLFVRGWRYPVSRDHHGEPGEARPGA